ncbi:MAG TPA: hypothetical protein VNJ07_13495, partial [Chitinophagales bacterium]|nr:hypothetical protein [Chitinophagales bacterium]
SPWKVIEDIDMLNGWQNYYTSPQSAKCAYRRILDKIEFKGQLNNSGTINQPFFQLPVGYRPAVGRHCACVNHGLGFVAILELSVATDGTCVIRKDSTLSSHAITSLDGVSFPLS